MLIITAKLYVDPERLAEFLEGSVEELRQARAEPGCVDFIVAPDPVEPGRVNLFEQWASAEDFAVRCATFTPAPSDVEVLRHEATKYEMSSAGPMTP